MRKSCAQCSGQVELKTLETLSAEGKPLKMTVTGMPVMRCRHGHNSPVDNDFMIWLIQQLKEREGGLPAGTEQGMLMFKKYLCACGKELAASPERRQGFPLELAYEGTPPFRIELEMPLYRCTGCGKEQLHSHNAVRGATSRALVAFVDAAGFPHSG